MNKRFLKIQNKLLPELIEIAEKRNNILKEIQHSQPVGRRNLAEKLNESERSIRNELDFLKEQRLIEITSAGTILTQEGKDLLNGLVDYIKSLKGISNLEEQVEEILGIKVLIVPGAHNPHYNKNELGRFAARELKKIINKSTKPLTLAVTGGTTVAEVANNMIWDGLKRPITVVPGRGGLGEDVEIQANTIAATFAKKLGGTYRMLHVPDNLQESTLQEILQEPQIREVLDLLASTDILMHGVGTAQEMAERRDLEESELDFLAEKEAVGEAFGFYFDKEGKIVYTTNSVGLRLDDLKKDDLLVVAVAEGEEKARAIISVVSPDYQDILITDEKTARKMLELK